MGRSKLVPLLTAPGSAARDLRAACFLYLVQANKLTEDAKGFVKLDD